MAEKVQMGKQVSEMIVVNCDPWENSGVEKDKEFQVKPPPARCQSREAILLEGRQTTVVGCRLLLPVRSFILLQPVDSRPLTANLVCAEKIEKPIELVPSEEAVSTGFVFPNNAVNNHYRDVQQKVPVKTYTCDVCSSVFMSKFSITNHVFCHLEDVKPPPHICKICGNVFTTLARLKRHLIICQNRKNKAFRKKCFCKNLGGKKCDICEKTFMQSLNLEKNLHKPLSQHIVPKLISVNAKGDNCGISESPPNKCESKEKKVYYTNKITYKPFDPKYIPLKCKFCDKLFASHLRLELHEQTHAGDKLFKCEVCGKCFSYKTSLAIHSRTHSGEKPCKCDICGECFRYSSTLKAHKHSHTGDKPFKCGICGKSFSVKMSLTVHQRIHTGYKPYGCETCGQCFTDSSGLRSHIKTHLGYKPHECEICGKCFTHSSAQKRHSQAHTREVIKT